MKSNIYYVEFYNGGIRVNKDKKNILDDIYEYLKNTEYDAIGENQLDSIIYNRTKKLLEYMTTVGGVGKGKSRFIKKKVPAANSAAKKKTCCS